MKKIGIIGLGIGSMYYKILHQHYEVITVDIDEKKNPMYTSLEKCINEHSYFDLFIICTPNHLHKEHALAVIYHSKIVLIEKPGLFSYDDWAWLYMQRQNIFMTKNNMFREEFPLIRKRILEEYYNIKYINITWINKSRVPFPGYWFTEKAKSWGGTSRDAFPHLLSEFYYLFNGLYPLQNDKISLDFKVDKKQNFTLEEVTDTDYGIVNPKGVFDVDDYCKLDFAKFPISIIGCWKSPTNQDTKIGIEVIWHDDTSIYYDFDLCPEYCYLRQFNYFLNIDDEGKRLHFETDLFIHKIIEKL